MVRLTGTHIDATYSSLFRFDRTYPGVIVTGKVGHSCAGTRMHDFQHALAIPQQAYGHCAGDQAGHVAKYKAALAGETRGVERSLKPRELRVADGAVERHVTPVVCTQTDSPVAAGNTNVGILGRKQRVRLRAVRGRRATDRTARWKMKEKNWD